MMKKIMNAGKLKRRMRTMMDILPALVSTIPGPLGCRDDGSAYYM
jgi:hypothetical protein